METVKEGKITWAPAMLALLVPFLLALLNMFAFFHIVDLKPYCTSVQYCPSLYLTESSQHSCDIHSPHFIEVDTEAP